MCPLCKLHDDSQEHILECHEILKLAQHVNNEEAKFSDVFGDVTAQKAVITKYLIALKTRNSLLDIESQHSLPGLHTGPTLARTVRTGQGRGDRQP